MFIGLTSDSADDAIAYIRAMSIPWPTGYGAASTWSALGACGPTLFVIDSAGRVAWTDGGERWFHRTSGLRDRLDRAIADCLPR
jgi:hypothetical protein